MKNIIEMNLPKTIYLGSGSIKKLADEATVLGTRPLIICDPFIEKGPFLKILEGLLLSVNQRFSLYSGVTAEPTEEFVYQAVELAKSDKCDYVIAVGGGSCLDTGKAAAAVLTNRVAVNSFYLEGYQNLKSPLPLIAIPTTAGTGSEATDVTVITDTNAQVKMMMKNRIFLPEVAIVDSDFTLSVPASITAATGLDALCHALESYVSIKANSMTKMFSLSALKRILTNIVEVYHDGQNQVARSEMMIGSTEAGIAFSNSSVTLIHGMSRPIGALFHIPHGISNAMLLPLFLEYSQEFIKKDLAEVVDYVFPEKKMLTAAEKSSFLTTCIKDICLQLKVGNLAQWGINEECFKQNIKKMAEDALKSGSPQNNRRVPNETELCELYLAAYNYH
jgi:alcohol dehydrogenase class IV